MPRTRVFHVDSKDRVNSSGASDNFYVSFPVTQDIKGTAKLLSCNIPISYYPIDSHNNVIDFQENVGAAVAATITPGVYTPIELATEIKTRMDAASPNTRTYTVSYNSNTAKYTIAISAGTFTLLFSSGVNAVNSANRALGFPASDIATGASQTSEYVIDISGPKYLLIKSNALYASGTDPQGEQSNTNVNDGAVLSKINMNGNFGEVITYVDTGVPESYSVDTKTLRRIDFYITDHNNRRVSLNGHDWDLDLMVVECPCGNGQNYMSDNTRQKYTNMMEGKQCGCGN